MREQVHCTFTSFGIQHNPSDHCCVVECLCIKEAQAPSCSPSCRHVLNHRRCCLRHILSIAALTAPSCLRPFEHPNHCRCPCRLRRIMCIVVLLSANCACQRSVCCMLSAWPHSYLPSLLTVRATNPLCDTADIDSKLLL